MPKQRRVYLLAGLTSIMLYVVGVFTGALIYNFTESKTSEEFSRLHGEIDSYGRDLESIELEQLYLASGQGELGCRFIVSSLNSVQSDLDYFWRNLPEKLEVYEMDNPPDEQYESLKRDYMAVSLKAWLLSLSVKDKCGEDINPILYFYSRDCPDCIEQGSVLDEFRESGDAMVYTIDLNLDSEAVSMVRDAYGIERAPALVVNDRAYQGLVSGNQLSTLLKIGGA